MQATYLALIQGDPAKAYDIFRSKAAEICNNPAEVYAMARLAQELGREAEVPALCGTLREQADHAVYAAYQIGHDLMRRGTTAEAAAGEACTGAAERYRTLVTDLLGDLAVSAPAQPAHHVAICGTAFCGSTLLDRLLNGMNETCSIGESWHWLTKSFDGKRAGAMDFLDPFTRVVPQCSVCGPKCEVLTPRFRAALAADPKDWYLKIAARLGARTLISADKNLPKLVLNDPLLRCDALILFKSPKQAWASELVKRPSGESDAEMFEQMRRYMTIWRISYAEMLNTFQPRGTKLCVNFDYLTRNPELVLRSIAEAFSLSFEERVLEKSIPGHSIGGNAGSMRRLRQSDYKVRIEQLGVPAIPADHSAWIDGNAEINALYHALNEEMIARLVARPAVKPQPAPLAQKPVDPAPDTTAQAAPSSPAETVPVASSSSSVPLVGSAAGSARTAPPLGLTKRTAAAPAKVEAPAVTPILTLPTFPIPTIPEEWLEGIFQDFDQQMRTAVAATGDADRPMFRLRHQFFSYLADNFDSEAYAALQRRHLVQGELPSRYNEVKYLDTVRWIDGKLSHGAELRLHRSAPLDILDLGTGPGHFQVVAASMGHRTLGLDVPLKRRIASAQRHLYDDLCDFFRVKKLAFGIEALKPLPELGQKFDLVTSFMTWFNSHPDNSPWSCEEWAFFLCDVRDRVLKPGGRLYLNLVKEVLPPEVWAFLSAQAKSATERNYTLLFENLRGFRAVSTAS